jgi:phospholipase/lecithinase/hemolysin
MSKIFIAIMGSLLLIASAPVLGQFYFFGDSLSDAGVMDQNASLPKTEHGFARKPIYTNPAHQDYNVWPFYVSQIFAQDAVYGANNANSGIGDDGATVSGQLQGNNYAAGGAVTQGEGIVFPGYHPPSLVRQVERFEKQHGSDANLNENVYFVWVGANDYLRLFMNFLKNPNINLGEFTAELLSVSHKGPEVITAQIATLHKLGAEGNHPKRFFVIELPKLIDTPIVQGLLQQYPVLNNLIFKGVINSLSNSFNKNLRSKVLALRAEYGENIEIEMFDPNKQLDDMVKQIGPMQQGVYEYSTQHFNKNKLITLTNYKTPACISTASFDKLAAQSIGCLKFEANSEHLVFADIVHPSASVHEILADAIAGKLKMKQWG